MNRARPSSGLVIRPPSAVCRDVAPARPSAGGQGVHAIQPRTTDRGTRARGRRGFTLIELLVVITIILLVSAVVLPTVLPAINHRQVSEAARMLQGALVGARDQAIHDGQPSGIRLLPDPAFLTRITDINNVLYGQIDPTQPLAYNRIIPLAPAPAYRSGRVSVFPTGVYSHLPGVATMNGELPLVVEQSPTTGLLNEPTAWAWNIRIGDKIQIAGSDQVYTVIGPMMVGPAGGNAEQFVNYDPNDQPRRGPIVAPVTVTGDYLYVVNGLDDDGNGIIDDGHNGLPPSPTNGLIYESEQWSGSLAAGAANVSYSITRRPAPQTRGREISLPTDVVIDATTWAGTRERSRFPFGVLNPWTGAVDVLLNPDGTVVPTTLFSTPARIGMDGAFYHFWLAERSDVLPPSGTATVAPFLPVGTLAPRGTGNTVLAPRLYAGPALSGQYQVVTLFARSGQLVANEGVPFDNPADPANTVVYNPNFPFLGVQQGIGGGP